MADLNGMIHIIVRQKGELGVSFECNPSEVTLSMLRKRYCDLKQVCLASTELWFGDVCMNGDETLEDLQMVDYDRLEVKPVEGTTFLDGLPQLKRADECGKIPITVAQRGEQGLNFECNPHRTTMSRIRDEYCGRQAVPHDAMQLWFCGVRTNDHQTLEDLQMVQYDVLEVRVVPVPVVEWETTLTRPKLRKLQLPVCFHPYVADGKVVSLKIEYVGSWDVKVMDDHHGHFYFQTGDWKKFVDGSGLRLSNKLKLKAEEQRGRLLWFVAYKL